MNKRTDLPDKVIVKQIAELTGQHPDVVTALGSADAHGARRRDYASDVWRRRAELILKAPATFVHPLDSPGVA